MDGYEKCCAGGNYEHIKNIMKLIYESGTHLEVSFTVHSDLGNDEVSTGALANFLMTEISPNIPLHLIRLMPAYKTMNLAPTNQDLLEKSLKIAKEAGLNYVYLGNVPDHPVLHFILQGRYKC